ncbi:MAG TPA: hypothetical protein DDW17_09855 [Deltaproteobacteria bacterium]|nr:hypothetical protein [Deltaproteobacteria bacterium]
MKTMDTHNKETRLLTELTKHIGESNAIGMGELYEIVFEKPWKNKINDTRMLRTLVTSLRAEGIAICSSSDAGNGGYYLASAGSEINDYLRRLERRALKILARVSKIKMITLPEYLGQMRLHMLETKDSDREAPDAA